MVSAAGLALVVKIVGDTTGLNNAMSDATASTKGFGGALGKLGGAATLVPMAAAAGAVAAGLFEVGKAGANAAAEEKAYAKAIEQAGAATGDWVAQSDAAIAAGQALAFTDSETMTALQQLTTATGDMSKSTELLATAQDVARMSGVDLETASKAVSKAYAGNDAALAKLIPGLEKGTDGMGTIANASKAAAGQAELFAESGDAAGMMVSDSFGELVEEIGKALLPAFKAIMPALQAVIKVFTVLMKAVLPIIIPLVELFAKGMEFVAKVLTKVADGIAWVIDKIKEMLKPLEGIGDALSGIKLPFGIGGNSVSAAMQVAGVSTRAGAEGQSRGFTVNIYGDPSVIEARVTRALRDYTRRNGQAALLSPSRL